MNSRLAIFGCICLLALMPECASADEREENCLLGQETAALFYTLLQTDPDGAERMLRNVDTRIARHAHYWAKIYLDKHQDLHTLATDYLSVCLHTGPARMPAPSLDKLK